MKTHDYNTSMAYVLNERSFKNDTYVYRTKRNN